MRGLMGVAVALVLCVGGFAGAAEPEEEGEIGLNLEFMYMEVEGADLDLLQIKREDDSSEDVQRQDTERLEHDEDFGFRGDLTYRKGGWGAGISGFHFDNDGGLHKQGFDSDFNGADSELAFRNAHGGNDCDGDELCFYDADSEFSMWIVDLYGIRELVDTPNAGLDLLAGIRIAEFDFQIDGLTTVLNCDDVDSDGRCNFEDIDETRFFDTQSESETLVGPMIALLADGRWGRVRAYGQLTQSVLFGDVDQTEFDWQPSSSITTCDAVQCWFPGDANLFNQFAEDQRHLRSTQEVAIPVTDIRFGLGFDIIDNVTLGVGAYSTVWWDVPMPPKTNPADRNNDRPGFDVEETFALVGASFSLTMRFGGGDGLTMDDLTGWLP